MDTGSGFEGMVATRHCEAGAVVGEWITYDRNSAVYKVTQKSPGKK